MIDIHNHIMYGIDDGCKTIEESLAVLKEAEKNGIHSLILTPHYIKGSKYKKNNDEKLEILNSLNELLNANNMNIKLYLGNEIYVENNMIELIQSGEASTLNGSRYILFELPMGSEINNLSEIIFSLKVDGYIPVIAHPERYFQFQKKPELLIPLIEQGCLFQANLGSLVGLYGKDAMKCVKVMLKHDLIHFMASDVHHSNSRNYLTIKDSYKVLVSLVGEDIARELVETNPSKIINNELFEVREPKDIKKKLFFF